MRYFIIFIVCLVFASSISTGAYAQGSYNFSNEESEEKMIGTDIVDEYVYPSMEVLSKLYWVMGDMEYSNKTHIDNYLRINECEIYKKYLKDEFEWQRIRDLTTENIRKNLQNFDTKIDIVRPIKLGEYNMDGEYFEVPIRESLRRTRVVESHENYNEFICKDNYPVDGYPKILRVTLTRPLEIERLAVKRQLARLFLDDVNERFKHYNTAQSYLYAYERVAYVRLKIRLFKSFGRITSEQDFKVRMHMMGELDGIEVYVDPQLTKPIYIENFKGERKISRRRRIVE